ncbi:MAG TPA: DEAD/DEAH box helicase [Vicinamibacteria bacterium]|nr:DEAD/DEAH box helicase [Vicinamibacteria bacterium]
MSTPFDALGLSAELLRAISEQGYVEPTPIQEQCIPPILRGSDLIGRAQTGTGKTAGFTLPMLQRLSEASAKRVPRGAVRALILTPTRELAAQVQESVKTYGRYLRSSSTVVFGGVGFFPQAKALRRGVDVLIATPGRLLDHVRQGTVDLSKVEILVLDEGDRMLDMGFIHDIRKILAELPSERQSLLFSATVSKEVRELADRFLRDPVTVQVAASRPTADTVSQLVHPVDRSRKEALLTHLIGSRDAGKTLVFCRTKRGADRLTRNLKRDGIRADAIHSNKTQGARTRTLTSFKRGNLDVLVATDIAARGLDIERLPYVVNYELPHVPEDYVHRIGRTGRAGEAGEAVSLVSSEETELLRAIQRLLSRQIPSEVIPGFEPSSHRVQPQPSRAPGFRRPHRANPERRATPPSSRKPRRRARRRRFA